MDEKVVVIDTVSGIMEAEILQSLLQSAGIAVELSREAALSSFSLGVGRLARVDLLVRADQEAKARELLQDYYAGRLTSEGPDVPPAED